MKPITFGRPVDVELLDDGSLIMTNDKRGEIYRIYYAPEDDGTLIVVGVCVGIVVVLILGGVVMFVRNRRGDEYNKISD